MVNIGSSSPDGKRSQQNHKYCDLSGKLLPLDLTKHLLKAENGRIGAPDEIVRKFPVDFRRDWQDGPPGTCERLFFVWGSEVYDVYLDPDSDRLARYLTLQPEEQLEIEVTALVTPGAPHHDEPYDAIYPTAATLDDGYPLPMTDDLQSWLAGILKEILNEEESNGLHAE